MTSVLVTGGAGILGSAVVRELRQAGAKARILSRRPSAADRPCDVEWAQVNLRTGAGLREALSGIDTIVHCTNNSLDPPMLVTEATTLLAAAREAAVRHFVYISIVGIDPLGFYAYYKAKLDVERLVAASGIPCSILRATQFHPFTVYLLTLLKQGPVMLTPPGATLQPVSVDAVARGLADAALAPPAGRLPDLAGPEALSVRYLARTWLDATGQRALLLPVSLPVPALRALRQMKATGAHRVGESWESWLAAHATEPNPYLSRGA